MLKTFREKNQSLIIIIFVFIISFVFLFSFGPQSQGCGVSPLSTSYAARVEGDIVTEGEFHNLYRLRYGPDVPVAQARLFKLKENTLDALIERKLLAHEATRNGFASNEDDVYEVFFANKIYLPGQGRVPASFLDEHGSFSKANFRMFVQGRLHMSIGEFERMEREELLADHMRSAIENAVVVSDREVHDEYQRKSLKVAVRYGRFRSSYFADTARPAPAEVEAWAAAHPVDVTRELERLRPQISKSEPRVRVRSILIAAPESASQEERSRARSRAQDILTRLQHGGVDMAALARQYSADAIFRNRGGDMGWLQRGRGLPPPLEEAVFALRPGQFGDLVETRYGYHIIHCEGVRSGAIPEDEARREVAEEGWRREKGPELAQHAAEEALRRLRAGETLEAIATDIRRRVEGGTRELGEGEDEFAPAMRETVSFGRGGQPIPGAPEQSAFVRASLDLTRDRPVPQDPLHMGGDFVAIQLTDRAEPSEEEFGRQHATIARELLQAKRRETVEQYIDRLKSTADANNELRRNPEVLTYEGGGGGGAGAEPEEGEGS